MSNLRRVAEGRGAAQRIQHIQPEEEVFFMRGRPWTGLAVAAVAVAAACIGCRHADRGLQPSAPPSLAVVRELADVRKIEPEIVENTVIGQYIFAAKQGDIESIRALCTADGVESAVQQAGRFRGVQFVEVFAYVSGEPHRYLIDAPEWQAGAEGPQPVKDVMVVQLVRDGEAWKIQNVRTERIVFQRVFFATLPIETLDEREKSAPLP